jgi:alanyl-tRNA synthetase
VEKQDYITRIIKVEEDNFNKTIDSGMSILTGLMEEHKAKHETVFSGEDAFKLYDTYGFPVDLTLEIIEEQGYTLDRSGFDRLMKEQRERARSARAAMGDLAWAGIDLGLDNTPTEFTGYERYTETAASLPSYPTASSAHRSEPAMRPLSSLIKPPSMPRWAVSLPTTARFHPTALSSR